MKLSNAEKWWSTITNDERIKVIEYCKGRFPGQSMIEEYYNKVVMKKLIQLI